MKSSKNGGLSDSQISRIGRVLAEPRRVQMLEEIAASTDAMPYIRVHQTHRVSSATFSHHIKPFSVTFWGLPPPLSYTLRVPFPSASRGRMEVDGDYAT